jgi:biotin-dependent carboxylase-like uncharacterized protein
MNARLDVLKTGPGVSVQDLGRPGMAAAGLSRGGAADRLALLEAAALLGLPEPVAGLEMAALGGDFTVTATTRVALSGAPMRAHLDGAPLLWGAAHRVQPGQILSLGAAVAGSYGYLTPAGGIRTPEILGSRAAHLAAGIGAPVRAGDSLPIGADPAAQATPTALSVPDRFGGGTLRFLAGPQTALFGRGTLARFQVTAFRRGPVGNRQGVRLDHDGAGFAAGGSADLVSDLIVAGDIQMTGAGVPYVLLAECQTIGGYPRIGTVLPCELPIVAQAQPGAVLRFRLIGLDEADRLTLPDAATLQALRARVRPLRRDPAGIGDLLGYQLISGVTRGDDLEGG